MENAFDKNLKQRLDNASLQEAGVRFDKDRLWSKIEQKKTRKRIPFLPWISHAAAIAAGLAIGIFLFVPKDQPAIVPSVAVQQNAAPIVRTVTDTVYVVRDEKHIRETPVSGKQTQSALPAPAYATTAQQPSPGTSNPDTYINTSIPDQRPQPTLVANRQAPPKVLHLSDMDNENAQSGPRKPKPVSFFALSNFTREASNAETFSMQIAQKLNSVKN